MVHLLHRLYGVDAPGLFRLQSRTLRLRATKSREKNRTCDIGLTRWGRPMAFSQRRQTPNSLLFGAAQPMKQVKMASILDFPVYTL